MSRQKVALITGCGAGGIGEALALEFQSKGLAVYATLLPNEPRGHFEGTGIQACDLDVTIASSITKLVGDIEKECDGYLDVLVNNAGIAYTMPAIDHELSEVQAMFAVNVFGPIQMVHEAHRLLIKAKGRVVNIGSVGGIVPFVYGASYNASKAALIHYGNTLRVELKPLGVKVINVISGEIGTNILKRDSGRSIPKGSYYSPLSDAFRQHVLRTPKTMQPRVYAAGVVREVLKPSPRAWYWRGQNALVVRLADRFLWKTFWDPIFSKWFKLQTLAADSERQHSAHV